MSDSGAVEMHFLNTPHVPQSYFMHHPVLVCNTGKKYRYILPENSPVPGTAGVHYTGWSLPVVYPARNR
jgi:hypothetical protein